MGYGEIVVAALVGRMGGREDGRRSLEDSAFPGGAWERECCLEAISEKCRGFSCFRIGSTISKMKGLASDAKSNAIMVS